MNKPRIWLSTFGSGEWLCAVLLPYGEDKPVGRGATPREAYANWENQLNVPSI